MRATCSTCSPPMPRACKPERAATSSRSTLRPILRSRSSAPVLGGPGDYCIYMRGQWRREGTRASARSKRKSPPGTAPRHLGEHGEPKHQGGRAVEGQRAMQFQSDSLCSDGSTIEGRDRLRPPARTTTTRPALIPTNLKPAGLLEYAAVCGETLACGHARAGDPCSHRQATSAATPTASRPGHYSRKFAVADYAEQTERDWQTLLRAQKNKGEKISHPGKDHRLWRRSL